MLKKLSLWSGYELAIQRDHLNTAKLLWSFDPEWMNTRAARTVRSDYNPKINYEEALQLKYKYIELVKYTDIRELEELYNSSNIRLNDSTWESILSHAPYWGFVEKVIKIIKFKGTVTGDKYEEIINHAVQLGNNELVEEVRYMFGDKYDWLYTYYLQSPHSKGDILAGVPRSVEHRDADAIGYSFGNARILKKYIKRYPKDTQFALVRSYKALKAFGFIDLFPWKECIIGPDLDDWIEDMAYSGHDYLAAYVSTHVKVCDE